MKLFENRKNNKIKFFKNINKEIINMFYFLDWLILIIVFVFAMASFFYMKREIKEITTQSIKDIINEFKENN